MLRTEAHKASFFVPKMRLFSGWGYKWGYKLGLHFFKSGVTK